METILVVDDEPDALRVLSDILTSEGYRVRPADSAILALASVRAELPDLILADVFMPGMDGFEFCRRLKARKKTAAIPLIFISSSTDTTARVEGLALGAVDFVLKPFREEELIARVRTHLDLGALRCKLQSEVAVRTAALRGAVKRLKGEIAERTRAETALSESEERFRNMADTAPVLIWVAGPDKLCTFFNKNWLDFTGRTMEQELGNGWTEGVHPDDIDRCMSVYSSSFDNRRPFRMEYRFCRHDGEYRWILHEGIPRVRTGGEFLGYVGSCIDVTDVRQAQQEAFARERVESLRVLAGGIAHDFTNLMGTILATAELAEAELDANALLTDDIGTIKTAAQQAVAMARELMIYAGQDTGSLEPLDLSQLVEDMAGILKTSTPKDCVLNIDLEKNLPVIWGNPTHIRQIVMNLTLNAADSVGGNGGRIRIRTSRVPPVKASDGVPKDADYVSLEVSDTGQGIPEEDQRRIFDPFFTTKVSGHGLGLAVVQGIVHSHDGVIKLVSTPGNGTTFEILLPCIQGNVETPAADVSPGLGSSPTGNESLRTQESKNLDLFSAVNNRARAH